MPDRDFNLEVRKGMGQNQSTMDLVQREISKETVTPYFIEYFGQAPTHVAAAPGRVNLIGEHTDYNNGFVMPMALDNHCVVAVAPSPVGKHRFCGSLGDQIHEIAVEDALVPGEPFWSNYVRGVLANLHRRGIEIGPVDMLIDSNVPRGGGLSSSAALEVAVCTALAAFAGVEIDPKEVALIGQAVEHEFVNVPCGIMDQFASVFGKKGNLIRLDCRSLEYQYFPFHPEGYRLVLMDSVVKHELASSAYNKRRQSCEAAVAAIQKKHPHVEFLRDCTMDMLEEAKADISAEDYMRAEYVIEEIQRVLDVCDALEKDDYETVGQKMYETHHGMSKLYEVSCEELDFLNDCAKEYGVTGSRVMGGGFGGCTINLVKNELYDNFVEKTKEAFKAKFGRSPKVYDVVIGDGSRRVE